MSLLDLSTATSPDHWRYLAEGGDTIVYSYIGPPDERFLDKVLRIRKDRPGKTEDQDITVSFHTEIIPRLVPHDYLVDIETISLRRSWLETLSTLSVHSRPAWRTDSIDFSRTNALLVPNLVSSPISVEIKASTLHHPPYNTRLIFFLVCSPSGLLSKTEQRILVDSACMRPVEVGPQPTAH